MTSPRLARCLLLVCALAAAPNRAFSQQPLYDPHQTIENLNLAHKAQGLLNSHRWQDALDIFNQLIARNSVTPDLLYWKAFALDQLGCRDDAVAAIAGLRALDPTSRWLDEARILEAGLSQSGAPTAHLAELEDVFAIQSLWQTDPERAVNSTRQILSGVNTPGVKSQAMYELARSSLPVARMLLEQVARGGANPDLQRSALSSLRKDPELLLTIYWDSNDADTKSYVQATLSGARHKQQLVQIASAESSLNLRRGAYMNLAGLGAYAEILRIAASDPSPELRRQVQARAENGQKGTANLLAALRASKDPKQRANAVRGLAHAGDDSVDQVLASAYATEMDHDVKSAIISALAERQAYATLAATVRDESDLELKRRAIDFLAHSDYVKEMLK